MRRPHVALATLAVLCTIPLAALIAWAATNGGSAAAPTIQRSSNFDGPTAPASMPAIDFALRGVTGREVRLSDYAGKVVVLAFLYSTCADACSVIADVLRGTLNELQGPVPTLVVSVDPAQDTREHVNRFLARQGLRGRVEYLVGSPRALEPIWRFFGVQPQHPADSQTGDFTVDVELLDKTGKPRVGYGGLSALDPDAVAHDIRALEREPLPRTLPARTGL